MALKDLKKAKGEPRSVEGYTRKDFIRGIRDDTGEIKLILMKYLGEEVFFAYDENWAKLALPGYVVYTFHELRQLAGTSVDKKRMVHEVKKRGGRLVESEESQKSLLDELPEEEEF